MSSLIMPAGMRRLGSLNFASQAASVGPITIAPCSLLVIEYFIAGYSGADIGAFQFNADTTATNYGSWFMASTNVAVPINSGVQNLGSTAMIPVSGVGITIGRRGAIRISNVAANRKVADIRTSNESTTTTGPAIENGWGEWLNTSAQITQVKMLLVGGNQLLAGTFAIIYGDNP